jgi:hypothetical protein
MPTVNLSPYTAESEAIARRLRMAEALGQKAAQPLEMPTMPGVRISPLSGLAKMLESYTAGRDERAARAESKALGEKYQKDISADFSSLLADLTPKAAVPEGAPTYTPNVNAGDLVDNARMTMQPERNEMGEIIQPGEAGAGNFGVTAGTPAVPATTGELSAKGFQAMRTPEGQQQYMAQLLAQIAPKEGVVLPENSSYITKSGKVLIQGAGKEDFHVPKNEFDPISGQTLTVAYSNKGNRKVIDTKGAYTPDQWNSIPVAERARLVFDQYKFGNVSATDLMQAAQKNVQLGQELAKLGFDIGPSAARGGVLLPVNAPMPVIPGAPPTTGAPAATMPAAGAQPVVARPAPTMPVAARPAAAMPAPAAPMSTVAAAPTTAAATGPIINQVTPKERQKLLLEQPQAQVSATTQMQNLDRFMAGAKELETHPGLESITGKFGQFSTFDVSEESRAARALQNTVIKQSATRALQDMREASKTGGAVGAVSQGEWPILEQQIAALDGAQNAAQYKIALQNLQSQLKTSRDRIQNAYEATYGPLKYTAPEYKKQELKKSSGWSVVN